MRGQQTGKALSILGPATFPDLDPEIRFCSADDYGACCNELATGVLPEITAGGVSHIRIWCQVWQSNSRLFHSKRNCVKKFVFDFFWPLKYDSSIESYND